MDGILGVYGAEERGREDSQDLGALGAYYCMKAIAYQYIHQQMQIIKYNSQQLPKLLHVLAPRYHAEGVTKQRHISSVC
jgi:hypothetical protein